MGYGNPGGKSIKPKIPNVPLTEKLGPSNLTDAIKSNNTITSSTSLLKATNIIKNVMSPLNGYTPINQSLINQPTRTPGGAGLFLTSKQPTSSQSPGYISLLLNPKQDPNYISADDPSSIKLMSNVGGNMGLLETAKSFAQSSQGKELLGGAVAALTGGKSTSMRSGGTTRAVNPRTGRPYRHMNSLNPHALTRATRRIKSFSKRVHHVEKALNKIHKHHYADRR